LPYAKTKDILSKAHNEGYGVGAFNVNDLEFIQAIVKAAVMEIRQPLLRLQKEP